MKRVVRIQGQGRGKDVGLRGLATVPAAGGVDSTVALIQALIPLGLKAVGEALAAEGSRRSGGCPGAVRWCRQRGAVSLRDQQLPITSQRVRDRLRNTEIPLPTSQQLQTPRQADAGLFRRVLLGLSCRAYAACAEAVPAAFGPSPSTISRRFIRASATTPRAVRAAAGCLRVRGPGPRRGDLRGGCAGPRPGDHPHGRAGDPGARPDRLGGEVVRRGDHRLRRKDGGTK